MAKVCVVADVGMSCSLSVVSSDADRIVVGCGEKCVTCVGSLCAEKLRRIARELMSKTCGGQSGGWT